jgi:hypothetical protein
MIWSSDVPATKSSASVRFGALPVSHVPLQRPIDVRDHRDRVAEGFEGFQDWGELEAAAGSLGRPVRRPFAHRHEHRSEPARWRGRGLRRGGERRNHGVEQGQRQRGTKTAQDGPAGQRPAGNE